MALLMAGRVQSAQAGSSRDTTAHETEETALASRGSHLTGSNEPYGGVISEFLFPTWGADAERVATTIEISAPASSTEIAKSDVALDFDLPKAMLEKYSQVQGREWKDPILVRDEIIGEDNKVNAAKFKNAMLTYDPEVVYLAYHQATHAAGHAPDFWDSLEIHMTKNPSLRPGSGRIVTPTREAMEAINVMLAARFEKYGEYINNGKGELPPILTVDKGFLQMGYKGLTVRDSYFVSATSNVPIFRSAVYLDKTMLAEEMAETGDHELNHAFTSPLWRAHLLSRNPDDADKIEEADTQFLSSEEWTRNFNSSNYDKYGGHEFGVRWADFLEQFNKVPGSTTQKVNEKEFYQSFKDALTATDAFPEGSYDAGKKVLLKAYHGDHESIEQAMAGLDFLYEKFPDLVKNLYDPNNHFSLRYMLDGLMESEGPKIALALLTLYMGARFFGRRNQPGQ